MEAPELIAAFVANKGILEKNRIPKHLRSLIPRYEDAGPLGRLICSSAKRILM